jgi:hypothetical protein
VIPTNPVIIVYFVFGTILVCVVAWTINWSNKRHEQIGRDLRKSFGYGQLADAGERRIMQGRVHGRLKELALEFEGYCVDERTLLQGIDPESPASATVTELRFAKLADIRGKKQGAEKSFLDTRQIAKRGHYKAHKKHALYLDLREQSLT